MKVVIDINAISQEEQKKLYLFLKAKFEAPSIKQGKSPVSKSEDLLSKQTITLGLAYKLYQTLTSSGIHTIKDLCNKTRWELLQLKGIGNRSCIEIETALENFGLELKLE